MPTTCHHRSLQIPDGNSKRNRIIQSRDKIPFSNGLSEWLDGGFLCNFINSPQTRPFTGRAGAGRLFTAWGHSADREAGRQSVCRWMAMHCLLVRLGLQGEESGDESHEKAWDSLKNSPELCCPGQETLATRGCLISIK